MTSWAVGWSFKNCNYVIVLPLILQPELLRERSNLTTIPSADCTCDFSPVLAICSYSLYKSSYLVSIPASTSSLLLIILILVWLWNFLILCFLYSLLRWRRLLKSQANFLLSLRLCSKIKFCLHKFAFFKLVLELFKTFSDRIDRLIDYLLIDLAFYNLLSIRILGRVCNLGLFILKFLK